MAAFGPPVPVAGITRIRFNGYDLSRRTVRQHPMAQEGTLLFKGQGCKPCLARHCEERSDEAIQKASRDIWIASLRSQGRALGLGLHLAGLGGFIHMDEILLADGCPQSIIAFDKFGEEFMQAHAEDMFHVALCQTLQNGPRHIL